MVKNDNIKELSVEELFDVKNKFLRDVPHPKLIYKEIKAICPTAAYPNIVSPSTQSLISFLESYGSDVLRLKLDISQSKNSTELLESLQQLLSVHLTFIHCLSNYIPDSLIEQFPTITQSGPIDYYPIKKTIKAEQLGETQIKQYLCEHLEKSQDGNLTVELISFIRAKKIVLHERL